MLRVSPAPAVYVVPVLSSAQAHAPAWNFAILPSVQPRLLRVSLSRLSAKVGGLFATSVHWTLFAVRAVVAV